MSGSWSELTRGISGTLSGSASARGIQAQVIGPAFAAWVSLSATAPVRVCSDRGAGLGDHIRDHHPHPRLLEHSSPPLAENGGASIEHRQRARIHR